VCLHPAQNAFLPSHHSLDHAFTLYTLVLSARSMSKPLYVVFLDLRGAYDSVSHPLLFQQLRGLGLTESEASLCLKLYGSASARVSTPAGLSASFPVQHGLLQGDPCSPVLFNYHIDDLARSVASADTDAPSLCGLRVPLQLHADDVALLSHSLRGIRRALEVAHTALSRLGHTVQPHKSAVLVFSASPRGPPPCVPPLVLPSGGAPLPVVLEHTYLGLRFSTSDPSVILPDTLFDRAAQTLACVRRRCVRRGITTPNLCLTLYRSLCASRMFYAACLWGPPAYRRVRSSP